MVVAQLKCQICGARFEAEILTRMIPMSDTGAGLRPVPKMQYIRD